MPVMVRSAQPFIDETQGLKNKTKNPKKPKTKQEPQTYGSS